MFKPACYYRYVSWMRFRLYLRLNNYSKIPPRDVFWGNKVRSGKEHESMKGPCDGPHPQPCRRHRPCDGLRRRDRPCRSPGPCPGYVSRENSDFKGRIKIITLIWWLQSIKTAQKKARWCIIKNTKYFATTLFNSVVIITGLIFSTHDECLYLEVLFYPQQSASHNGYITEN